MKTGSLSWCYFDGSRLPRASPHLTLATLLALLLFLCKSFVCSNANAGSTTITSITNPMNSNNHHHLHHLHHYHHRPLAQQQLREVSTGSDQLIPANNALVASTRMMIMNNNNGKQSRFDFWMSLVNKNEELSLKLEQLESLSPQQSETSALHYIDEIYTSVQVKQQQLLVDYFHKLKNQTAWPLAKIVTILIRGPQHSVNLEKAGWLGLSREDRVRLLSGSCVNLPVVNSINSIEAQYTQLNQHQSKQHQSKLHQTKNTTSEAPLRNASMNELDLIGSLYDDDNELMIDNNSNNSEINNDSANDAVSMTTYDDNTQSAINYTLETAKTTLPPNEQSVTPLLPQPHQQQLHQIRPTLQLTAPNSAKSSKEASSTATNFNECTRTTFDELNIKYRPVFERKLHRLYKQQAQLAVDNSNLITNLLIHSDNQLLSKYLKRRFFRFLVKLNVQTDEKILASGLIFTDWDPSLFSSSSAAQPVRRSIATPLQTPANNNNNSSPTDIHTRIAAEAASANQLQTSCNVSSCNDSSARTKNRDNSMKMNDDSATLAAIRRKRQYLFNFRRHYESTSETPASSDSHFDNDNSNDYNESIDGRYIYAPTVYRKLTIPARSSGGSSTLNNKNNINFSNNNNNNDEITGGQSSGQQATDSGYLPPAPSTRSSAEFTYVDLSQHRVAGLHSGSVNSYFRPGEPIDFYKIWLVNQQIDSTTTATATQTPTPTTTSTTTNRDENIDAERDNFSNLTPIKELIERLHKQHQANHQHEMQAPSGQSNNRSTFNLYYTDGKWSAPYLDCGVTNTWLITYSVPFFSLDPHHPTRPFFR